MRFPIAVLTALTFCLPLSILTPHANAEDKPDQSAQDKLQGRWEIVGGVNQGRELAKADIVGTYVTITTNSIVTYDSNDNAAYAAVFTIDESQTPMQITMRSVAKNAPTQKVPADSEVSTTDTSASGIVKIESDSKWVLCYALPGAERPKKFESPKGSKIMLFTLGKKLGDPVPVLHPAK
ncbi:uncharacterized domain TIGR03067 protein [Neorhodopirellula lusitana]|uniref:Uncharacterized domain TIGR03067 protein n=1 Tax=Neorhodopirellula lusitana TaxID=445327 RepID=A0ABY1QFL6_9BACT|nr:TIGR03067 domain-containing protein [Neorhodopirellula lusitana]SMP67072.1 uncharacterized domain TIGR03067 protein [Neorhodopirellula lusitana]